MKEFLTWIYSFKNFGANLPIYSYIILTIFYVYSYSKTHGAISIKLGYNLGKKHKGRKTPLTSSNVGL